MIGPVLFFRGLDGEGCRLAAVVVLPTNESPAVLRVAGGEPVGAKKLGGYSERAVWCYTFVVPPVAEGEGVDYSVGDRHWRVYPPSPKGRLRIAFTACNGRESDRLGDGDPERNAGWRQLAEEHAGRPFQLLLQGGDQLYADGVWDAVPELAGWVQEGRPGHRNLSPGAVASVADFYFEMYCWVWGQPDLAPLLASIPSLMMWDDHDIFDGWGSHTHARQASPVFRAVWSVAREQFALFQLGTHPDSLPEGFGSLGGAHFGWAFALGPVGIIAPDLRSERTRKQVMGQPGWAWFTRALAELSQCRHILLISSVPLINLNLSLTERLLAPLPNDWLMQDDLRDQWRSYAHRKEWRRMVSYLLDFAEKNRARITVLSGEVHLGALGRVRRGETELLQLISSGIVHPPPHQLYARVLDLCSRGVSKVSADTRLAMLLLPGLKTRYLAARNWLSLDCEADGSAAARWHAEGVDADVRMVIPGPLQPEK